MFIKIVTIVNNSLNTISAKRYAKKFSDVKEE